MEERSRVTIKNRTEEEMAQEYRRERFRTGYKGGCDSVFIGCWGILILGEMLAYTILMVRNIDLFPGLLPFIWGTLVVTVIWIIARIYLAKT